MIRTLLLVLLSVSILACGSGEMGQGDREDERGDVKLPAPPTPTVPLPVPTSIVELRAEGSVDEYMIWHRDEFINEIVSVLVEHYPPLGEVDERDLMVLANDGLLWDLEYGESLERAEHGVVATASGEFTVQVGDSAITIVTTIPFAIVVSPGDDEVEFRHVIIEDSVVVDVGFLF